MRPACLPRPRAPAADLAQAMRPPAPPCQNPGRTKDHAIRTLLAGQRRHARSSGTIAEEPHATASAMTAAAPHTAVSALTAAAPNYGSAMTAAPCQHVEASRRHRRCGEHQMGGAPAFSHKVATNPSRVGVGRKCIKKSIGSSRSMYLLPGNPFSQVVEAYSTGTAVKRFVQRACS